MDNMVLINNVRRIQNFLIRFNPSYLSNYVFLRPISLEFPILSLQVGIGYEDNEKKTLLTSVMTSWCCRKKRVCDLCVHVL